MFNIKIDENEIFDLLKESEEKVYCVYQKEMQLHLPDSYVILNGNGVKKIPANKVGEKNNLMTKAEAQKAAKIANKEKFARYRIADYYKRNGMTRPT